MAEPSGRPAETKPNTLPTSPGGEASRSITSRGVREVPSASPAKTATAERSASGSAANPGTSSSAMAATVSRTTVPSRPRRVRSAIQPPTKVPAVAPTM